MNEIIYEILCQLGLEIKNNIVLEQGSQRPLQFNNKILKIFNKENPTLLDSTCEMWFDPIHNAELAEKLTQYYIIELAKSEDIRIQKVDMNVNQYTRKTKLICNIIQNGEKNIIETKEYTSQQLAFLEIILDFNPELLLQLEV